MKRGAESSARVAGFTIVETMIVLAVTGMLFVAIATTWFGRQHKTEFQTSAQDIRGRIQQVISDVQNGYFPDQNNFKCDPGTKLRPLAPGETSDQGTNQACVFLGKVIQFNVGNKDPQEFRVYTVAADSSQTDLAAANPTVVAPSSSVSSPALFPDNSTVGTLNSGLAWRAYKINGTVGRITISQDIAIGFLSSLGELKNGAYTSGVQHVDFYALPEPPPTPTNSLDAANAINALLQSSSPPYSPNTPTQLCFQSGGTNQYAVITIGANSSALTADLSIKDGTCDVDFS